MVASANKKVLVARFDRETLAGFLQTPGGLTAEGVELLTPGGNLVQIPYTETKAVCFVRDFDNGDTWLEHRAFAARPKSPGLWVRLRFRDGDSMEGTLSNNLLLLDPAGFHLTPPDPSFHNQRVFVPKAALREVQVLGVIGSPLRRRASKDPGKAGQIEMFE